MSGARILPRLAPQLGRFGAVGVAATAVHAAIYSAATARAGVPVLSANFAGFAGAFLVSYFGHRFWTFAGARPQAASSLPRFLLVAFLGLCSNTLIAWLLVTRLGWPAPSALIGILFVTPMLVFVASKYWAFAVSAAPAPGPQ